MSACEKCQDKGFVWRRWRGSEPPAHWDGDEYKHPCDCPAGERMKASAWAEQFR